MHHGAPVGADPTLRSIGLSVYLPTFIFAVGQGAVIPIVALSAVDLGASVAIAGLVVGLRGVGTLLFDVPAGSLVSRFGERRAMGIATVILIVALAGCTVSEHVVTFGLSILLMGCAWSVWLLARLAYVSDLMPVHLRGRALSTLGGVARVGNFVGPFVGAIAIGAFGLDGAYLLHIVLGVAGCAVLFLFADLDPPGAPRDHVAVSLRALGRQHTDVWLTAGVGAIAIGVLRASRQVVLPLWGARIGIDAAAVSLVFGMSSAMDMMLFYPAGLASDRWGRKAVAVPCMSILALGFILLPLTGSFWTLVAVGVLLGFGNGLGSGIVMTLGADFCPPHGRAEFLGLWRLIGDLGTAGGPFVIAIVTSVAGLVPASIAVAAIGSAGAAVVGLRMPEPIHREPEPAAGDLADSGP